MARSRTKIRNSQDYWPSFVDVMTTLLLVLIFLLSIFMITQFFLSKEISSKDSILSRLNGEIAELTTLLALERSDKAILEDNLRTLQESLTNAELEHQRVLERIDSHASRATTLQNLNDELRGKLDSERQISASALSRVELLNQQISALRRQLNALAATLDASEQRDRAAQVKITDLGRRLNIALAQKAQKLARYRSDFFGRLRDILSKRDDIRIVGDRFVFQSELFFDSGSADINPGGQDNIDQLAKVLLKLETEIPSDIPWVLRIDGHTDSRPIQSTRFPSNWELSAARAISVVRYLIDKGVSSKRLVAAGFGPNQPIANGSDAETHRKNRRIELKLTRR